MRAAAAIVFVAAGFYTAFSLRRTKLRRVQILQTLCALLREMETQTAVLHRSLPSTVESLSQTETFKDFLFLRDCLGRYRNGVSFAKAWNEPVSAFLHAHRLRGDGAVMLPQLGASFTCVDDEHIEKVTELYLQYLQSDLHEARQTLQTSGKRDVCLCIGGGLLLGIMVL